MQSVFGPLDRTEEHSDGSGTGSPASTALIDTGTGVAEGLLDEAVTSAGDTAQWIDDECEPDDQREPGDQRPQCKERPN